MKKMVFAAAMLIILPAFIPSTIADVNEEAWVKITEPQPGIYMQGRKILPSHSYIFVGTDFVYVNVEASDSIFVVYLSISDVMKKEIVQSTWDYDRSDGFSYNFTSLPFGIYAIAAVGAALDINNPVAFDWIMPVVVIHV